MLLIICVVIFGIVGCQETKKTEEPGPDTPAKWIQKGLKTSDDAKAAECFRRALELNQFSAPAHNDLGVVEMRLGNYYSAASHFDQASRLMPANPQPRINLGLVYEYADQFTQAQKHYEDALVVAPDSVEAKQCLARVRVRESMWDDVTLKLLQDLTIQGTDATWRDWAQRTLAQHAGK
jgi:Flp pilus assembly protein TadD